MVVHVVVFQFHYEVPVLSSSDQDYTNHYQQQDL